MAQSSWDLNERFKALWPYLLMAMVGFAAYLLTRLAIPERENHAKVAETMVFPSAYSTAEEPTKHRKAERTKSGGSDEEALLIGAIPNQRVLVFKNQAALEAFLARKGNGISTLGRIDQLNALLVRFRNLDDLTGLLDGTEKSAFNFPASIPEFESEVPQEGAVALGSDLLKWLGIEGSNELWGTGVKIAVLDTGIADHLVFKNPIQRINLVALPSDPLAMNGHGTTVASLIASSHPYAPGVAPGATLLSVRIATDDGTSTSWLIAQGILAALDAGADVINISLGGQGRSTITAEAIAEAKRKGVPIIASAGNSGKDGVLYPASDPYVIAPGAVDAKNQPMDFSTTGLEVDISAAGYGVNAAYPGGRATQVSGTSGAAGVITGMISGLSSPDGAPIRTTSQAAELMMGHLHDVGTQGRDNRTGGGVPNAGTILHPKQYDASVNSIVVSPGKAGSQAQVLIQNVGTSGLVNTGVSVTINGVATNVNLPTLAPMESRIVNIPVPQTGNLDIRAQIQPSGGRSDQRPSNDFLSRNIPLPTTKR